MQAGWRIGSLFGIPLFLDSSWFVILVLVTIANRENYLALGPLASWGVGFVIALLLFSSVLLHELGHSFAALSQGIKVNSITLFLFGGVAAIDRESKTPRGAFQVAIAGPLVSFGLFFLFSWMEVNLPNRSLSAHVIQQLADINLVLAVFNLIPGLPLDGGQVLKAAVWQITGNRFTGVRWAAKTGLILGWTAIALGLGTALGITSILGTGGIWIALIGWFSVQNASSYQRITDLQEALCKIKASDAMTREFRVVDANLTLQRFADDYLLDPLPLPVFFAASEGRYRGLVSIDALRFIERSQWQTLSLQAIVQPLDEIISVLESTPLLAVINKMELHQLKRITVLSPADAVAGVIDRGDMVRAMAEYLKIPFSPADIRRIKEEGVYPPKLQLNTLAKMTAASLEE